MALKTLTSCFSDLGVHIRNPRRTWAASSDTTAVVTLWQHRFSSDGKTYSVFGDQVASWTGNSSNKARTKVLKGVGKGNCFRIDLLRFRRPDGSISSNP